MEEIQQLFGRRVRELRRSRGLTQEALAKAAGLDDKHIGALERAEKTPSLEAIGRLAKALQVEYYELLMPERLTTGQVEQQVKLLARDLDRLDAKAIRLFLDDLLAALRKLEQPPRR
jgi:transcriptional regulator with XRE-family HTH domain